MYLYNPERVFIEPAAMDYPLGKRIYDYFGNKNVRVEFIPTHNRVTGIPGKSALEKYLNAKNTLVVGIKKDLAFDTCKPSADYQISLVTSCPGHCEYCYLQTTLGKKPYIRIYANIDEMLMNVSKYIEKHSPEITTFEGASTGDPLSVEHITGSLAKTIEYFGKQPLGRFRFVTKFDNVDSLLNLDHNGHTRFRFSVNSSTVVDNFEGKVPSVIDRLKASAKVIQAGYPTGYIIAPIMYYPNWKEEYTQLLETISHHLPKYHENLTFELIQHRFTNTAKQVIMERFPQTQLDLDETTRQYKYGKYGRGKWIYPKEIAKEMEEFLRERIKQMYPSAKIEYFT